MTTFLLAFFRDTHANSSLDFQMNKTKSIFAETREVLIPIL